MRDYVLKRLLVFLPTMLGVTAVIFVIVRLMPGDVADAFVNLESGSGYTQEQKREVAGRVRREAGLDRPLYVQYGRWLGNIANGSFGYSYWEKRPISEMIMQRAPVTIELAVFSIILSILWAVPSGVVSAMKQNSWVDHTLRIWSIAGLSIPSFWMGIVVIFLLATVFNWLPPLKWVGLWDQPRSNLLQIVFPALVAGYTTGAPIARLTRSEVLEVLREDYVRTAWAKGLSRRVIMSRHVLRNAILPVITLAGWNVARMLAGLVVIETVFNLPGIGTLLIQAIALRDYEVVGAIVLIVAGAFVLINLAVDILAAWVDPRMTMA